MQRVWLEGIGNTVEAALEGEPESWNARQRHEIGTLAGALLTVAITQRSRDDPTCAKTLRDAFNLASRIGSQDLQQSCAYNFGCAYLHVTSMYDLDEAAHWYKKSLELLAPGEMRGQSATLGQLGIVAHRRCLEALKAKRPTQQQEVATHLAEAAQIFEQTLEITPHSAIIERGVAHDAFAGIYFDVGDLEQVLYHCRHAIRYFEQAGDRFRAGGTRLNVAMALRNANRFPDALAYAQAALADFQTFGDRAAAEIQQTERLIAAIQAAQPKAPPVAWMEGPPLAVP